MRLALALILFAGAAGALPPDSSLRPVSRAAVLAESAAGTIAEPTVEPVPELAAEPVPELVAEPVAEPEQARPPAARRPQGGRDAASSRQAGTSSLRPALRTAKVVQKAVATRRERQLGAVCGDPDIQGDVVGPVPGRIAGCGIEDAVRVRSVAGIELTQRAVMDCRTAASLTRWVSSIAKPALSGINGGLARLKVAAHYTCRTRNGKAGARISEHGKGRAIDISGFHMRNGSLITVEQGWAARATTQALRKMHDGACGPFGTVLGPEANRHHQDHFHFDTARYRSGTYCR